MAFWAAIPAIASLASGLFGKKEKEGEQLTLEQMMPSWQSQTGQNLANWIQKNLSNYNPTADYTGNFTAPMTSYENQGLGELSKYLGSDTGDAFAAGKQQIMDTLGGRYANPNESPYIKAMTNLAKVNLRDAIDQSRASAGSRGNYFTRSAIKNEGRISSDMLNNLNAVIGQFQESERGRQFAAAPLAAKFGEYETSQFPLSKIEASQTYGALPRTIEQADLEARYNDFLRKQNAGGQAVGAAQSLYGTQTPYGFQNWQMPNQQENSPLGNILGMISNLNLGSIGKKGSSFWDIFSK